MGLVFLGAIFICYLLYGVATYCLPAPWAEFTPYAGMVALVILYETRRRWMGPSPSAERGTAKKKTRVPDLLDLSLAMFICFIVWAYFASWYWLFYAVQYFSPPGLAEAVPYIGVIAFMIFHAVVIWRAPQESSAEQRANKNDDDDDMMLLMIATNAIADDD